MCNMREKKVLFGISARCQKIIDGGILDMETMTGLFDNMSEKWGTKSYGLIIEEPKYLEECEIIITAAEKYQVDILRQLLDLGYRQISLVVDSKEKGYEIRELDFRGRSFDDSGETLILLYLQHQSYSGISAITYLMEHGLIDTYGYRVKVFEGKEKNEDYYEDLIRARYFITERDLPIHSEKITTIQLWHGFPLKCMGTMDAQFDVSRRESVQANWNRYDYIASYGLNYTTFISACFGTVFNKFVVTGMPRNDLLFCTDGRSNIEKKFPQSIGKKVIFYMPTFREFAGRMNGNKEGYIFYWPDFDIPSFEAFCAEHNLYFIFKLHPSDSSKVKEWCYESEYIGLLTDELLGTQSTYEFLNGTDALLTDYSSVYFDYLLLDKPIIFTNRDEQEYIQNRGVILEPLDFWRPGLLVNNMEDLKVALENVANNIDEFKDKRKELIPFVHKYTDGKSTQRLYDFIRSL